MPDYMERMRSIHDLLTEYPLPGSFRIAVGGEADIGQTRLSYKQAELCLRAAAILKQERPVLSYDTMGIFALWGVDGPSQELRAMCSRYVKPLKDYKKISNVDLIETLKVFFQNKQNYTKTGQDLFVHANTIRYRIEQVEHLCNVDFSNYLDVLNLQVALACSPLVM